MNNLQKTIKVLAICFAIFIIVNICYGIIQCVGLIAEFSSSEEENLSNFREEYSNITSLDIELVAATLTIEQGSTFRIEATKVGESFTVKEQQGTLKVEEHQKWFSHKNRKGNITISIPASTKLNKLSIDTGAGKINIDTIQASDFDLNQGAGTLNIKNSLFDKTDIDGGAGEMKIESSTLHNLDMDAGVGKVTITSKITGNSKIECGVGEIELTLLGTKEEYSIRAEKGIGSIQIDGQNQASDIVYGNGTNKLELEGGIGSIVVNFQK